MDDYKVSVRCGTKNTHTTVAVRQLARFVAETSFADLPGGAQEQGKRIVADSIGVALSGSREPEVQRLCDHLPREPGARILCAGFPETEPCRAAFINATALCFLELDEGCRPTGHPALHVFPAALALSQALRRSGRDFLVALILGYEVQARLSWACNLRALVHPHGNLGNAGAIAATGKLCGWSHDQIFHGLNVAAGLAIASSWEPCFRGATVRNVYPGMTAQTAFTVKWLIESGFSGYEAALSETFGEILGDSFEPNELVKALGRKYWIERNYFKFHAACASVHPVLDALADAVGAVRRKGKYPPWETPNLPRPTAIQSVRVYVAERSVRLDRQAESNQLSAKFSIPFAVATYLINGTSSPESFSGEALKDRRIRELAERVHVLGDVMLTARWPEEAVAEVRIMLASGRELVGSCRNPYGSGACPASREDLAAKFRTVVSGVLSGNEQDAVWGSAFELENIDDMAGFPLAASVDIK